MPPISALSSARFGATIVVTHNSKSQNPPKLTVMELEMVKHLIRSGQIPGVVALPQSEIASDWISRSDDAFSRVKPLMPHPSKRYKVLCTNGDNPADVPPTQLILLAHTLKPNQVLNVRPDRHNTNIFHVSA